MKKKKEEDEGKKKIKVSTKFSIFDVVAMRAPCLLRKAIEATSCFARKRQNTRTCA